MIEQRIRAPRWTNGRLWLRQVFAEQPDSPLLSPVGLPRFSNDPSKALSKGCLPGNGDPVLGLVGSGCLAGAPGTDAREAAV